MPTLNWIGKEKVVSHHQDVPYKVLEHVYGFDENGQTDIENKSGNKIIKGDSLYFESEKNYAAATKNVSIVDSLNNSIITGHYGEVFKEKDSAIITRRALAINIVDNDSLFIHADTLVATGPKERRILRAYYDVKILKSDLRGISDSLYLDESIGLTKLLNKPLSKQEEQIYFFHIISSCYLSCLLIFYQALLLYL